jgi:hypothetical protein
VAHRQYALHLVDDFMRQSLATGNLRCQRDPISPAQAIERQPADPRLAGPGRLKLGAERNYQQHW